MILDNLAQFSDAQSGTTSVASTDIIDTLAAGDQYVGQWLVVKVDTAYTSVGTAVKNTFQLQTSTDVFTGGGTDVTLAQSSAYTAAQLTAGKTWAIRIPPGVKRYLRVYKLVSGNDGGNAFSAGKFDAFITPDIDLDKNKRYMLS